MTPRIEPTWEPAAKLWELLRRNPRFRRVVAKMLAWRRDIRANRAKGIRLLSVVGGRPGKRGNPIAADALRWLAPDPWFMVEEKDQQGNVTRLGVGTTPDPQEGREWRWFDGPDPWRQANLAGWPLRWGPEIKAGAGRPDRIAEWRAYFEQRTFTIDTPWEETPEGFKHRLRGYWSSLPGMSARVFRTRYFEAESPAMDESTVAGLARGLEFRRLSRHLVLAMDRPRIKADVSTILQRLKDLLEREVDRRHGEFLGTEQHWRDFLDVDAYRQGDRSKTGEAIRRTIMVRNVLPMVRRKLPGLANPSAAVDRWYPQGVPAQPPDRKRRLSEYFEWKAVRNCVRAQFAEENPRRRPDLKRNVGFMDVLVDATFPAFDLKALLRTPRRRG